MDDLATKTIIDTQAVVEDAPIAAPDTPIEAEATPEVAIDAEAVVEDVPEVETSEDVAEVEAEAPAETVTFDAALPVPELVTKATEILDKYELPPDVQASFDAMKARIEAVPVSPLTPYEVYGGEDDIKVLLDRQTLLDNHVETSDGNYRPQTDKFVETLAPQVKDWMFFDLAKAPSTSYAGKTKFEEGIIDLFGKVGEPVSTVLARYEQFTQAMQSGMITTDLPAFVPMNLQEAFYKLPRETRNELSLLDPEYEDDQTQISNKVAELALIQDGLNSQKQNTLRDAQDKQSQIQNFTNSVLQKEQAFYDSFRDTVAEELEKTVIFSTDPVQQRMLARERVSTLANCLEEGNLGGFARTTLKEAGIAFDLNTAKQLQKGIESAAVALSTQERMVDQGGQPINRIEFNKAKAQFATATGNMQTFGKKVLDQVASLVSTKKAAELETAVAKVKVPIKARPGANGASSAVKKVTSQFENYPPGDPRRYVDLFAN